MKRLRKKLYHIKKEEQITFVHGIGHRKSPLQKSIETLEGYISKLKEYTIISVERGTAIPRPIRMRHSCA